MYPELEGKTNKTARLTEAERVRLGVISPEFASFIAKETREGKMAQFGKEVEAHRLVIAGTAGDKVAEYLYAHGVESMVVAGAAKVAQDAVENAIRYQAYLAGIESDPRD